MDRSLPLHALATVVGLGLFVGVGCDVTPDKIATWKETERGPVKLREAVRNGSLAPDLRGLALTALVELGMLGDAEEDLKAGTEGDRKGTLHAAAPLLATMAKGDGAVETKRQQRNAKDALFQFRGYAAAEDLAAIDDALIAWTTVDLAGRMTAGGQSSEKILGAIGARAGARLAEVVGDGSTSDQSRMEAARLIGKAGDKAAREQAGATLVERARKAPKDDTLQQLGLVGGDHAVAFLTQLAEDGSKPEKLRKTALLSLAQGNDAAFLPAVMRIAGDAKAPLPVRDAAFTAAEKVGSAAVPGLIKLMEDKDEQVRWRAIEAAFKAGKAEAVAPVLEGLSTARSFSKDDLESFVVHDLELIGPLVLPALRGELKSKSWVARVVAVIALGKMGRAEDAARLEALAPDATRLKGWAGGGTIGSEARAAAALAKARP
ncbi:MAG: hypothetical protein EXR72_22555 [Myxococcales bacterium]|nr:hypothetical protein [Myxococcales bacterium]